VLLAAQAGLTRQLVSWRAGRQHRRWFWARATADDEAGERPQLWYLRCGWCGCSARRARALSYQLTSYA